MTSATIEIPSVPGGWYGSDLAADPESWRLPLPEEVREDLLRAAAKLVAEGDLREQRPEVSERTMALVAELYRRLAGEPGMVVLTGFPVQDPELTERAYLVLGRLLGQPVLQTLDGQLLVPVEVYDSEAKVPGAGKAGIPQALPFHIDRSTDIIGLLCIRRARVGGLSLLVSSKTVHNILAENHPDLLRVLYQPIPVQMPPLIGPEGERPMRWCGVPVFSQVDGHFAAYCDRYVVEAAQQRFPDAPRLTGEQVAALDAVDEVTARRDLQLHMNLEPGDLQLINNLAVLHSRTAYESAPPGRGRLLIRLHLAFGGSPALPPEYADLYGVTAPGTYRGGLWRTQNVQLGAPLPAR